MKKINLLAISAIALTSSFGFVSCDKEDEAFISAENDFSTRQASDTVVWSSNTQYADTVVQPSNTQYADTVVQPSNTQYTDTVVQPSSTNIHVDTDTLMTQQ